MPYKTYHNLDSAKRERFYSVALAEFADHGYQQASITKIVKKLNIAKGSVYQYFEDKYDLYCYLVRSAFEKLSAVRELIDKNFDGNLEQWFINRCLAEVKFLRQFPMEYEIIIKTLTDRSSQIAKLNGEINALERSAIIELLELTNLTNTISLSFIISTVKQHYLADITPDKNNDKIVNELRELATHMFMTD